jgi:predicted membrane-bound spermidine synthase
VAYFGALGMGFIICEVALMQRLILLLGHPIYTLVVILFVLLLASALGSFFARRFEADRIRAALGRVIPLVVLLIVLGAFALPSLIRLAVPLELPWRIAIAAALTLPFGFLMGMPFPLGLRRAANDPQGAPVSVLWGVNGVASVIGSIGGMLLAMAAGFTVVFLAGAACYVLAWSTRPR